ncbi:di-heme-cytochrome C peroxidase [Bradyrhizobium sp.]|uniref:di-heme-cytochrome C peroxidase n=1 Tax=Bradyrhizobium sp. TaxID=376 RepID=UPI0025C1F979|nr:di-heme-cytochrome C peroxidase [Bradyrhizobium sp.]
MKPSLKVLLVSCATIGATSLTLAQSAQPPSNATPSLQYANQGWTDDDRQAFYTTSQGSHMIPYLWFKALRRLDVDEPFAGDQLVRYGYLPNDRSKLNPEGLPVGFAIDGDVSTGQLGMSCAACHTGQVEYQKDGVTQQLRIDGAPALTDFQAFLTDLTTVSKATLENADRFGKFAHAVLGNRYSATRAEALKTDFAAWLKQWTTFMDRSLPASSPWGPGRLDAFGMIFNRVAGKDLGIDANFQTADAPVSYPFLWNASRQDKTQWTGGVPNGLYINAIGRNAGEVFGVFADFSPKKRLLPPPIDYGRSSIKFTNLQQLEEKIRALRPPPWPFALDQTLVDKGRVIYAQQCGGCHDPKPLPEGTWLTQVQAVGTDPRTYDNAQRTSQTGILAGELSPNPPGSRLSNPAATDDVLATVVVGALFEDAFPPLPKLPNPNSGVWLAIRKDFSVVLPELQKVSLLGLLRDRAMLENVKTHLHDRLANIYKLPGDAHAYEARVLRGIWATAPYLHNGSVPNLWELLTSPAQRQPFFMVGSRTYDPKNVGFATDASPFKSGKLAVSGADVQPGNGNGGHEYGTALTDEEKWALIEYLKQL